MLTAISLRTTRQQVAELITAVSKIEGGESAPVLTRIRASDMGKTGAQKKKPPDRRL
jgi:hypothetical protein